MLLLSHYNIILSGLKLCRETMIAQRNITSPRVVLDVRLFIIRPICLVVSTESNGCPLNFQELFIVEGTDLKPYGP